MRERGSHLNSPEARFMFGGPDQEQIYLLPDGSAVPYDRATAAVDHIFLSGEPVDPGQILTRRDRIAKQITQSIPTSKKIEKARKDLADELNRLSKSENG